MKNFLIIAILTFSAQTLSSQSIKVNPTSVPESTLGAEELTVEVLIDGGECSTIENFELKENNTFAFPNPDRSWGYFEKGDSDFPFESGIVLTSGIARKADGPDSGIQSDGNLNWAGDPDANILAGNNTKNATIFEFDFIPQGNEISFNYIFASEEYPTFACSDYNDVFGFIISGPGITPDPGLTGKNIALLPNDLDVTINNVNGSSYNPGAYGTCGDDTFYVDGLFQDIEYGGRTTPLTAFSEVQPGETYHIRLLVSDAGDPSYDSAVFLEAGSFYLGGILVDLNGIEIGEDETICDLEEYTLMVNVEVSNAEFQWYLNNEPIAGATEQQYTATQSGTYSVTINSGQCQTEIETDIAFSYSPLAVDASDFICNPAGSYNFNLNDYQTEISTENGLTFSYYSTENGAETEDLNQLIPDPENFEINQNTVVYVRVQNESGCYKIVNLTLEVGVGPETQPQTYAVCDGNGDELATFDLTTYTEEMVISDPTDLAYGYFLDNQGIQEIDEPYQFTNTTNPQIVYVKIWNPTAGEQGCILYEELTLEVKEFPVIQNDALFVCDNLHDHSEIIDLTQNNIVQSNVIPVSLHYYTSQMDLTENTNEIVDPEHFELTVPSMEIFTKVQVTNNDCAEQAIFTIGMKDSPDAVNAELSVCSLTQLGDFYLPDANESVVSGSEFTINYFETFTDAVTNNSPLADTYQSTSPNQIIYARVENENGCYDISEVVLSTVQVHKIINHLLEVCDDPYLISDGIAEFDLTQMNDEIENALGSGAYSISYFQNLTDAQLGTNPIPNAENFANNSNPQILYARATASDGSCGGTAEFKIEVLPVPELEIESELTFCGTESGKSYEVEGSYESYTWYNSTGEVVSTSSQVEFGTPGIYTVEVTENGFACPAKRDVEVIFDSPPTITDIEVNEHTVTVTISGSTGPFEFSYNNGLTWHDSNILYDVPSGIHSLIVKSKYGCLSVEKPFGVLGIPNLISPNGDGYNDFFTIRGLELSEEAHIKIFDRYGKIFVDRKVGPDFIWDGMYNGRPIPTGDYWYILTVDEKQITGHITIKNY